VRERGRRNRDAASAAIFASFFVVWWRSRVRDAQKKRETARAPQNSRWTTKPQTPKPHR
jgi:hypothetical protein